MSLDITVQLKLLLCLKSVQEASIVLSAQQIHWTVHLVSIVQLILRFQHLVHLVSTVLVDLTSISSVHLVHIVLKAQKLLLIVQTVCMAQEMRITLTWRVAAWTAEEDFIHKMIQLSVMTVPLVMFAREEQVLELQLMQLREVTNVQSVSTVP